LTTGSTLDNTIVQVLHPLLHFLCFVPTVRPVKGFYRETVNEYGDVLKFSAPRTPTVRDLVVFLSALVFAQAGIQEENQENRTRVEIPLNALLKTAGMGRTQQYKKALRESLENLSHVGYSVYVGEALGKSEYREQIFKVREKKLPYRYGIFPGLLGDVVFSEDGATVTVHIHRDFVENLDVHGLRVSLTHVLSMKGHIAQLLTFVMYGRQAWAGTWEQLAKLAQIEDWEELRWQKKALKKALDELNGRGFRVEVGDNLVKIARKKTLGALIDL